MLSSVKFELGGLTEKLQVVQDALFLFIVSSLLNADEAEIHVCISLIANVFEGDSELLLAALLFDRQRDNLAVVLGVVHSLDTLDEGVLETARQQNLLQFD